VRVGVPGTALGAGAAAEGRGVLAAPRGSDGVDSSGVVDPAGVVDLLAPARVAGGLAGGGRGLDAGLAAGGAWRIAAEGTESLGCTTDVDAPTPLVAAAAALAGPAPARPVAGAVRAVLSPDRGLNTTSPP
jgi:hypothetical protein